MKKVVYLLIAYLLTAGVFDNFAFAQTEVLQDSIQNKTTAKERIHKNIIRFNLTNPVILSEKSIIFGYERVIGTHMSFSVNAGYTTLPPMRLADVNVDNADIQLSNTSSDKGFNFSVDYRFYLNKVNKFNSPRGVYLAPFYSYNNFQRENIWLLNTTAFNGEVVTDYRLDIHTFGGELGYQFILWKRLALDFVLLGPGIASYSLKTDLSTTLDSEDQAALFQLINDHLADKFPGYSRVIDEGEYLKSGSAKTTDFGFRYMIHLGFLF